MHKNSHSQQPTHIPSLNHRNVKNEKWKIATHKTRDKLRTDTMPIRYTITVTVQQNSPEAKLMYFVRPFSSNFRVHLKPEMGKKKYCESVYLIMFDGINFPYYLWAKIVIIIL